MKIAIAQDAEKQAWRSEYQTALTTLTDIRDAESMTNAEAVQAVKYMARVLLLLVKLFARTL